MIGGLKFRIEAAFVILLKFFRGIRISIDDCQTEQNQLKKKTSENENLLAGFVWHFKSWKWFHIEYFYQKQKQVYSPKHFQEVVIST